MEPEDRIKCRDLCNSHVPQSKDIVYTVMDAFKVANITTVGPIAHLVIRLVGRKQLIDGITNTILLLAYHHVDIIVTTSSIGEVRVEWVANSMIPILEFILSLEKRQYFVCIYEVVSTLYLGKAI